MKSFDDLFEQLLTALQTTEKRHRAVRDSASDNSDWNTYDSEGALISNIIKWRRSLEQLRSEIDASGAVTHKDMPVLPTLIMENQLLPTINIYNELAQADMLSRSDDERIGHYIWHEMKDIKWHDSLPRAQTTIPYDQLESKKAALPEISPPEPESTAAKTKPTHITLLGKEYPVGAWNEMYIKVCEVMLLHSPYKIASLDKDAEFNTEQRTNFSYIRSDIKFNGKRLSNGLWVETKMDNQATLKKCHRLLEKCGFTPDALQVETMEVI